MKAGPLNPRAVRLALAVGDNDFQIIAGTTYVLGIRGDLTGSTITATSFLGTVDDIEVIDEDAGGVLIEDFPTTAEGTFCTTGNWIRVTRAHGDPETAPALIVSYIEAKLSGTQ